MPLSCGVWGGWISKGFVLLRGNVVWGLVGFDRALLTLPFLSYCGEELGVLAVKAHMASCCPAGAGPCVSAPCFRVRAEQPGLWHEGSQRHAPATPGDEANNPDSCGTAPRGYHFFLFFIFLLKTTRGRAPLPSKPRWSQPPDVAHTPQGAAAPWRPPARCPDTGRAGQWGQVPGGRARDFGFRFSSPPWKPGSSCTSSRSLADAFAPFLPFGAGGLPFPSFLGPH